MKKKTLTTRFVETYKGMKYTERIKFQTKMLQLEYPITHNTINRWVYIAVGPKYEMTAIKVAEVLKDMGYDVDADTLFERYAAPAGTTARKRRGPRKKTERTVSAADTVQTVQDGKEFKTEQDTEAKS